MKTTKKKLNADIMSVEQFTAARGVLGLLDVRVPHPPETPTQKERTMISQQFFNAEKLAFTFQFVNGFFFYRNENSACPATMSAIRVADIVAVSISDDRGGNPKAVSLQVRTRQGHNEVFEKLTLEQTEWFFEQLRSL